MSRIRARNHKIILQAACIEFAKHGYAGAKIINIAKQVNLPKANIYYYFQSKEKLYRSVLESIIDPILDASKPFEQYDDPAIALTEYIHTKIWISQEHPYASKVFANEIMHGAPHLPADIAHKLMAQTQRCTERLNEWINAGKIEPINPHHLLFTVWAATQTYADFDWQIQAVTGKSKLTANDYQQAAQLICHLVLRGCGLDRSEPS